MAEKRSWRMLVFGAGSNSPPLDGHPLIGWSIAAGPQAELVDRVLCSTDHAEMVETAVRYRPLRRR